SAAMTGGGDDRSAMRTPWKPANPRPSTAATPSTSFARSGLTLTDGSGRRPRNPFGFFLRRLRRGSDSAAPAVADAAAASIVGPPDAGKPATWNASISPSAGVSVSVRVGVAGGSSTRVWHFGHLPLLPA